MKYKKLLTDFFKLPSLVKITLIIASVGVLFFLKLPFGSSNNSSSGMATLAINFETEKRLFEGEVVKDMTVLDALNAAVSVGKIKLNYAIDESDNVNVMEIDGHTNRTGNKYFVFYINSEKVAVKNLNKEAIRGGDRIEIRNE